MTLNTVYTMLNSNIYHGAIETTIEQIIFKKIVTFH